MVAGLDTPTGGGANVYWACWKWSQDCWPCSALPTSHPTPLCHQVGGILRIAHCGGLHVPQLNKIVEALNFVAKLLHRRIRWDTETLGCVPSLSSIPAMEQRLLTDAFQVSK